jgi:hypothetical protein
MSHISVGTAGRSDRPHAAIQHTKGNHVKLNKRAAMPALAASALVATAVLGAGAASAGTGNPAGCNPGVTVSPGTGVTTGSSITITGTGFGCKDPATASIPVTIRFMDGRRALANNPVLATSSATAKNGKFSVTEAAPAVNLPAGTEVTVEAETTSGTFLSSVNSFTLAGSSSGGSVSVPAGHVDVAEQGGTTGPADWEIALAAIAGLGLVGAGVTVAARRNAA